MNYNKLYRRFIESKKSRVFKVNGIREAGYDLHHILPKSLGGNNKKSNLVKLTYREHYIAHRMLAKMYKGERKIKMSFALYSLRHFRNRHRHSTGLNARQYEYCRNQYLGNTKTQEWKKWASEKTKRQWTPERRARQAEITRQQWRDGKKDYLKSEEYRKKQSVNRKKLWKDPSYRKFQSEIQTKRWAERKKLSTHSTTNHFEIHIP